MRLRSIPSRPARRSSTAALRRILAAGALAVAAALADLPAGTARAEALHKIGEMELQLLGVQAGLDPLAPVVPKNVESGVRVVVTAGGEQLAAGEVAQWLGGPFEVHAELSGPGLPGTVTLPQDTENPNPGDDPLILRIPALAIAGDYELANIRLEVGDRPVLAVDPDRVTVKVIDQILVTAVSTRALTLDEIREKGIVLDSDDYLGFEFTLGMMLESTPVDFKFPVVFDRQGVPIPPALVPPPAPERTGVAVPNPPPLPTIVPMLLEAEPLPGSGGKRPPLVDANGQPIRIPSVLVIPGNVGYLKQFFSAQLFVANGAPGGSELTLRDVTGTVTLPVDGSLALPETTSGVQPRTMPVRGLGADGQPGTPDDDGVLEPGQQGQAEFLLRGEREGFHTLGFDIRAVLDGLVTGPVVITGRASGGVLVRNPYFDVTFTVPSVVRDGEGFDLVVTVTNIGQGPANDLFVAVDASRMSGVELYDPLDDGREEIDTLAPGDAVMLRFRMLSRNTGQVVASYLNLDTPGGSTGTLRFTLGVGERGVPLSPDTLVLPAAVDALPSELVDAAMRVLGQAWSIANAPAGTLPQGVLRTSKTVVTKKALALAEAGLRVELGQAVDDAVRDLFYDYHSSSSFDAGFDQLLRQTEAGRDLVREFGEQLQGAVSGSQGVLGFEEVAAEVAASGPDFVSFAVSAGVPFEVAVVDAAGQRLLAGTDGPGTNDLPGAVVVPITTSGAHGLLGIVGRPTSPTYRIELTGSLPGGATLAVTVPRGDGTFVHGTVGDVPVASGLPSVLVFDASRPDQLAVTVEGANGVQLPLATRTLDVAGPRLLTAAVIGPETLDGASLFGMQSVLVFDRVVDAASASNRSAYTIPSNRVASARPQLSGRLVFAALEQPEGPYVPTTIGVNGISDSHGNVGPAATVDLDCRLLDAGAVVSGRVLDADGTPVPSASVVYTNQAASSCEAAFLAGLASRPVDPDGRYELRYVRQDPCGLGFSLHTQDPSSGARRTVSSHVRMRGEQLVLDIVLLGRGSVAGTVRDGGGQVVPGADVRVVSVTDPQVGGVDETDGDGRYLIPGITVGQVNVSAAKGAFAGKTSGRIDRAGTTAEIDVTLNGGSAEVSGKVWKVEDGLRKVVPGIPVVYYVPATLGGVPSVPVAAMETRADGTYAFTKLPSGPFRIDAALNTRDRASLSGTVGGGETLPNQDLDIIVEAENPANWVTVEGTVSLPGGAPAPDVIVSVDGRGVLTDVHGHYVLTGVVAAAGPRTIQAASRDGKRKASRLFTAQEGGATVTGVDLTLSGVGTAVFTVLDPAGLPVVGQEVRLSGCGDPCGGCGMEKTNGEGKATFADRPLGTVAAQAWRSADGYVDGAVATASITRDGDVAGATLRFRGAGTVTGLVLDQDGAPAVGADVVLRSNVFHYDAYTCGIVSRDSQQFTTTLDGGGRFRFDHVLVGEVGVTASQTFLPTPVGARGVLTGDGQSVDFTLRLVDTISGELSGHVFLPDGVTPAGAGVEVTVNGPLPDVVVSTDAQGLYRFAKIFPEGSYTITARDPVTGGLSRSVVYLRALLDVTHDVRLEGRGTVRVKVVDGADNPVDAAYLALTETDFPGRRYEEAIEPGSGGTAEFRNVFEGGFAVEARDFLGRGGRASGILPRAGSSVDVTVRLTTTGRVTGHFLKRDRTTPVPNGLVKLLAGGRLVGQVATAGSGDVGSFAFDSVPAGPVQLEAQDPLTGRTGLAIGSVSTQDQVLVLDVIAQGLGTVQGLVTRNGVEEQAASVQIVAGSYRASTFTDAVGHYVVSGVPEGEVGVTASLEGGLLAATGSGTLSGDDDVLTIDVALQGTGSVAGQVVKADGVTAAPISAVTIRSGGSSQSTVTAEGGGFRFERVPAGTAYLSADVLSSDDGGTATVRVEAATQVPALVRLRGLGLVAVTVVDWQGTSVEGALVRVGGGPLWLTGTGGTVLVRDVPSGLQTVEATDSRGLGGVASVEVEDGQTVPVTVHLEPAGSIEGLVVEHDRTNTVHDAAVSIPWGPSTTSNQDGRFSFEVLPLGTYHLMVLATNGDRAMATVELASGGQVATPTVFLTGLGSLSVTVTDHEGNAVSGAAVKAIVPQDPLNPTGGLAYTGTAGSDGVALIHGVLAGQEVTVSARHPNRDIGGSAVSAQLEPGETLPVAVVLDPVGVLRGLVLGPDGTTPVSGATVTYGSRTDVSRADGTYELLDVPLSTSPRALSATLEGRLRARVDVVVDDTTPVEQELRLIGLGIVEGTVRRADGTAASGLTLSVRSDAGPFGGTVSVPTDSDGFYRVEGIAVGQVTVSFSDGAGTEGHTVGVLATHGQTLTLDVDLIAGAVNLAGFSLKDAIRNSWSVQKDGTLLLWNLVRTGSPKLTLSAGGEVVPFSPTDQTVPSEESRREIVFAQAGPAGLLATRKVYVPRDGYFVRYLETLENPTPADVEVVLTLATALEAASEGTPHLAASSSGAASASPADLWLVMDDDRETDVYDDDSDHRGPFVVFVRGEGGLSPSSLSAEPGTVTQEWTLTVPAGGRASIMHGFSYQTDPARGQASAERLVGLPPELLAGLTTEEGSSVRNFLVPANLASALAPLPAMDGAVRIRPVGGDGQTPIPVSLNRTRWRSRSPYYGKEIAAAAGDGNTYTVGTRPENHDYVPREDHDFGAEANGFRGSVHTATASGSFDPTGVVDLTTLAGRQLRSSSGTDLARAVDGDTGTLWSWAAGDAVYLYNQAPFFEIEFPYDVTVRRLRLVVARPGGSQPSLREVQFEARDSGGAVLWSTTESLGSAREVDVSAPAVGGTRAVRLVDVDDFGSPVSFAELEVFGEGAQGSTGRSHVDLVFEGTGLVEGRVLRSDATPFAGVKVKISRGPDQVEPTDYRTDEAGAFLVPILPPQPDYVLTAFLPSDPTHQASAAPVAVVAGAKTVQDLVFGELGAVQVNLQRSGGGAACVGELRIFDAGQASALVRTVCGSHLFADLRPGTYTVRATDALLQAAVVERPVTVVAGTTQAVDVELPMLGSADVLVVRGGAGVQGSVVEWRGDLTPDWIGVGGTNAAGQRAIGTVTGPTFRVRAFLPGSEFLYWEGSGAIEWSGQRAVVTIEMPPADEVSAPLSGTIRRPNGTPWTGMVGYRLPDGRVSKALTDSSGHYSLPLAPAGLLYVRADDVEMPVFITAGVPATADLDIPGAIRTPGERHLYETTLVAGQEQTVEFTSWPPGSGEVPHPRLEVYAPDGALVGTGDNLRFTPTTSGAHTIVATTAQPETGFYNLRPGGGQQWLRYPMGTVSGRVLFRDGSPAADLLVRITTGGIGLVRTMLTGADGSYLFRGVPEGDFTVAVFDDDEVRVGGGTGAVQDGAWVVTSDLTLPDHGTVTARVRRGSQTLEGVEVTLESDDQEATPEDRLRTDTTDADGEVETWMPAGTIVARAVDPLGGATHEASGTLLANQALEVEVVFPVEPSAISGVVRRGGSYSLPGAEVELSGIGSTTTDGNGSYRFESVPEGTYTITASFGAAASEQAISVSGGEYTLDFTLSMPELRGVVREPDGRGAEAEVEACGYDATGTRIPIRTASGSDGSYRLLGFPGWKTGWVSVTARVPEGSSVQAGDGFWYTAGSSATYTVNLTLPETGSIAGTVRSWAGQPQADVEVVLQTVYSGSTWVVEQSTSRTDGTGAYRIGHVLPGQIRVFAADARGVGGEARGTVMAHQELGLDVTLDATGTIAGDLVDESGQPLARTLHVQALEGTRRQPTAAAEVREVVTDADGHFTFDLARGLYRVVFYGDEDSTCGRNLAAAEGTLAAGEQRTIALQRGSHLGLLQFLEGSEGSYGHDPCTGQTGAGLPDTALPWGVESYPAVAAPEQGGRGLRTLLVTGEGLRVRRQQFVPSSGNFARTYTAFENVTDAPVTIEAQTTALLRHQEGFDCSVQEDRWEIEETSSGDASFEAGDTWALAGHQASGFADSALVFGGVGFVPGWSSFWGGGWTEGCEGGYFRVTHQFTIPPHATRAILAFATDDAATAQALADLTEAEALVGLTAEEQAAIANFEMPGTLATLSGRVQWASGNAVPGARVVLLDEARQIEDDDTADSNGTFDFGRLDPGRYLIVAIDPASNRPGQVEHLAVAGEAADVVVTLLSDAETGTIEVTVVEDATNNPIGGFSVGLVADAYWPAWSALQATDGAGQATFTDVPAGRVVMSGSSSQGVGSEVALVAPGDVLQVTMRVGQREFFPIDLTGADGFSYLVWHGSEVTDSAQAGSGLFFGPYALVDGQAFAYGQSGTRSADGREVTNGPRWTGDLLVTRRTFVPAAGRFARSLDVLENVTDSPLEVPYELVENLGTPEAGEWAIAATSSGDLVADGADRWVVFTNQGGDEPNLVLVLDDGVVGRHDELIYWVPQQPQVVARWSELTVPAHSRRLVLRFMAQVPHGDLAQAVALAEDLSGLTDPDALAGLSPEERALIVNFVGAPAVVVGTVMDGASAVDAQVSLVDDLGRIMLRGAATAATGFRFESVPAGHYRVVAEDASGRPGVAEVVAQAFETSSVLVELLGQQDLGTVHVTGVLRANGQPDVPAAGYEVEVEVTAFVPAWLRVVTLDANGEATVTGVPSGEVVASAEDATGLPVEARGNLDGGGTLDLSLTLTAPLGSVQGVVLRDGLGSPDALVSLEGPFETDDDDSVIPATADGDGVFAVTGLLPGRYDVLALDPATRRTGTGSVWVAPGQVASIAVELGPATELGTVRIHGVLEGSGDPAAGAVVDVRWEGGLWSDSVTLDGSGEGTLTDVPPGWITVVSGAPPDLGYEEGELPPAGELEVTLRIGNRAYFPIDLTGADGLPYVVARAGGDGNGGAVTTGADPDADGGCWPFCVGFASLMSGDDEVLHPDSAVGVLAQDGREVVHQPGQIGAVTFQRRTYVPASGRFLRMIEIVENGGTEPVSLDYYSDHGYQAVPWWQAVATSDDDAVVEETDRWLVLAHEDPSAPVTAHVVSGPGGRLTPSLDLGTWEGGVYPNIELPLTLAPGERVLLLQFFVQRPHDDVEGAVAQATALADLSDPEALAGLTAEDRAAVVNFAVPPDGLAAPPVVLAGASPSTIGPPAWSSPRKAARHAVRRRVPWDRARPWRLSKVESAGVER